MASYQFKDSHLDLNPSLGYADAIRQVRDYLKPRSHVVCCDICSGHPTVYLVNQRNLAVRTVIRPGKRRDMGGHVRTLELTTQDVPSFRIENLRESLIKPSLQTN